MKRSLSLMLVLVMIVGMFTGIPVSAAETNLFRFRLNSDGESYSVSGFEYYVDGDIIIPTTYMGKPVTGIENYAFNGEFMDSWETGIRTVHIPDSVVSIGEYAFNMCSNLITITGGNNVEIIGEYAFNECKQLESFIVSDKVSVIPKYLFSACEKLESVTVGDGVEYIDEYAFSGCTSLDEVVLGNNLKRIGTYAFRFCESLPSLELPDSVKVIEDLAFVGCDNLGSISIPAGIETIGDSVFNYCKNLRSINVDEQNAFYSSDDGVLFNKNKDTIIQYPVGKIDAEYVIPDSVTTIGHCGFYDNDNLISVTIPESVTSIGENAFYSCENLQINTVPNSVTTIGDGVFGQCVSITSFVVPDTVINLGDSLFRDCYNLVSVELPENITKIPFSMFSGCKSLTGFQISETVERIEEEAFMDTAHETFVIPDNVKSIGFYAFGHSSKLTSVVIGDGVTTIDGLAFCNSNKLTTVRIGKSVTSIKNGAFSYCPNIKNVTFAGSEDAWKNINIEPRNEAIINNVVYETPSKPKTPKVSTTNEINGIKITWNAVEYAVKYNVYRRQAGSKVWTLVGTTTGNSITDAKVSSGIFYCYSVRAYNSINQYSDYIAANTQLRKFMAVPKLTGISNATNGLYIKWNAVAGVTNGYRVYRRGAGQTTWTYLKTVKTTYYTDTQVKNNSGEYYRYTVIADGGYHSKFDTTGLYLKRLANPSLNSAVSTKSGINVKWGKVSGTTGYYVYRKTADSNWVRIAAVGGTNNTTYLDKTAKKGVTYTYTVRAVYGSTTSYFYSGISCKDKY